SSHVELMNRKEKATFKLEDFQLGKEVGKGGFGVVYTAVYQGEGAIKGQEVAIKKVNSNQRSELLRKEVENHQRIDHENIVKFYGYFKENNTDYIVMELCKESLRKYVKDNGAFSSEQAVPVLRQLMNALEYLHKKGICHRDLTSGNVLIHRTRQNGVVNVKLCDFGLSKVMSAGRAHHTVAGTPGYMDPHVTNHKNYGKEVDVYSLGCVLYVMLTGFEPGTPCDDKSRFPRLDYLDNDAVDLIMALTNPNLHERIKLEDIKSSSFVKGNSGLSRHSDHPTSFHSRRSMEHKPVERMASIDRLSIRDRSKSRGPRRERNQSPPVVDRIRSRSTSRARIRPSQRTCQSWPINIERLEGKQEESGGYRLEIVRSNEAVLTEINKEKEIMIIRLNGMRQKVGIASACGRHSSSSSIDWFESIESLPESHIHHYNVVIRLLEDIRWKVAKVIFNNSSICKGGIIRLMENGDMRMKDKHGKIYSVRANSDEVYEGNPKTPTGTVSNMTKRNEILKFRDICERTEDAMTDLGFAFPFISYDLSDDTKTVKRNAREAMGESSGVPASRMGGHRTSREVSAQHTSRATKSTCSHVKKSTVDTVMTNWSAPGGSMQQNDKENGGRQISIMRSKNKDVVGIKDRTEGVSLRFSTTTPHQYIYTDSKGLEHRFTFAGDYSRLSQSQAYLMRKLNDRR
ncbi:hypothetical protein PMAYCL1PPCAC_18477, partial [Pristionchus mayeri]